MHFRHPASSSAIHRDANASADSRSPYRSMGSAEAIDEAEFATLYMTPSNSGGMAYNLSFGCRFVDAKLAIKINKTFKK